MEKIADYAENITKLVSVILDKKYKRPESSLKDIKKMQKNVSDMVHLSLEALINSDKRAALKTSAIEVKVDSMKATYRKEHIKRLGKECNVQAGVIYVDIVSNLERVADNANTVSKLVIMEMSEL